MNSLISMDPSSLDNTIRTNSAIEKRTFADLLANNSYAPDLLIPNPLVNKQKDTLSMTAIGNKKATSVGPQRGIPTNLRLLKRDQTLPVSTTPFYAAVNVDMNNVDDDTILKTGPNKLRKSEKTASVKSYNREELLLPYIPDKPIEEGIIAGSDNLSYSRQELLPVLDNANPTYPSLQNGIATREIYRDDAREMSEDLRMKWSK